MAGEPIGAILEKGPSDWQIAQQDERGLGAFELAGRWVHEQAGNVEARLVAEATGTPVTAALDWQPAETFPDGVHGAWGATPPPPRWTWNGSYRCWVSTLCRCNDA
jgi:hypothetical protein